MTAYATTADADALLDAGHGLTDARLADAARRIDGLLGPFAPRLDTGLKLDPADLPAWARLALARAVVRQAQWDAAAPAAALGEPQRLPSTLKGPDFEVGFGSGGPAERTPDAPLAASDVRALRALLKPRIRVTP